MRVLLLGAIVALASASACPSDIPEVVPNGNWGGQHMGMVVADTGARIEYDCASGVINVTLRLSPDGAFDWAGIHYPGHGGPSRIDEPLNSHAARYTGHATAEHMTITLTLLDGTQPPQTFTLDRGGNARVLKCL